MARPGSGRRQADSRNTASLRAARARLVQGGSSQPEFDYDLLAMFARNETSSRWTIPVLAMILALAMMTWAPLWQAAVWVLITISARLNVIWTCEKFLALPSEQVEVPVWRHKLVRAEAICGIAFASFALVGIDSLVAPTTHGNIEAASIFLFAALMIVLAIRMTFAASVPVLLDVGTVPMTAAIVIRLLAEQTFFDVALALMALGVHLYFSFLARGLHATTVSMLQFRAQKDLLISELEEAKAFSDEVRHRAESANNAKSRFLATMSHELRTPLNAILGFSEVMCQEIMGPMANRTYLSYARNIHDSGSHLLHLINEILDLSRIEAGRYELHEELIHVSDIVEDCHRLMRLRAETKGVDVVNCFAADLAPVWADQRSIRQICLNLVSNAIKFTPRGGRIELVVEPTPDGGQMLSVCDTGPGIPADEIPKVLQAFGQGSLAHQTAEGGTGLGLPIVKNLIELHGGRFELESELRKGTCATVYLPPQRVLHQVAPLQPLGKERHAAVPEAPVPIRSGRQPKLVGPRAVAKPRVSHSAVA